MVKVSAIALLGALLVAPLAHASETPAFVNATMCDAAAPIASGATIFSRQIRAERPAAPRAAKRAETRAQARRSAPAARPAPASPVVEEEEAVPGVEAEAVLRPALHFCLTPAGNGRPVRYT